MADFRQLLTLLKRELKQQEQLLELLSHERAAVVKMNQDDLDKVTAEKEQILTEAQAIEGKRNEIIHSLSAGAENLKFKELLERCNSTDLRSDLERVGAELKKTAESVREFHSVNAQLLKQAMGLVATTIAIFRSASNTELPTYGAKGTLKQEKDGAPLPRASAYSRQA